MGDIADMMLDGTLCEGCGEFLGDGPGFVQLCGSCEEERAKDAKAIKGALNAAKKTNGPKIERTPVKCPICSRSVTAIGIVDHLKAKHAPTGDV